MALVAGVRSWPVVITTFVFNVLAAGAAALFARRGRAGTFESMVLAGLAFSVVGLISVWLGPFVLVPTAGATVTLWFAMHSTGRERYAAVAIGLIAVSVPFAVDMLHLAPAAYAFRDGHIELYPRALALPPRLTLGALIYTSLGFVALPALFLGRLRDALSRAEGQLFLQAWHLEQWMAATDAHRGERASSPTTTTAASKTV